MRNLKDIALIVVLLVISAAPRLVGLGRFTSVDEPFWLRQGANFYYAVGQRDFANTIYEYHPAVTTMWIIAAGMLAYFPNYRLLGQGYLKPGKFDLFLPAHGKDPLQLLVVSRGIQGLIVVALLLLIFFLLRRLFDTRAAFLATVLISVSPFLLGHSRLLNHEALLGLLLIISVLSLLLYLRDDPRFVLLLTSAVAGALAQLSKSSGILLFPLVVLALAATVAAAPGKARPSGARRAAKTLGVWLLVLAASYVLFWPGMWVAPGTMLYEVYGNALAYAFQGSRLSVLPGLDASGFGLDTLLSGLRFYLSDLAWRTTPVTGLGLLFGVALAVAFQAKRTQFNYRLVFLCCSLLAAAFVLMFSIQRGPKPPHYILTAYICLDLIAGLGFSKALDGLARRVPRLAAPGIPWAIVGLLAATQLASSSASYPYYISYYNPLVQVLQLGSHNPTLDVTGYGMGLDQAAAYLSQKADARELTVISANGYGCFSYYFPGHTIPMNNLILSDPEIARILRTSQYAVVDFYNQRNANLVGDFERIQPEKTIVVNGIDFLRIYRTADLLPAVQASP
jgi:4-amino-4-deoxy-L-arabinose transferase-like glycosyltransferase